MIFDIYCITNNLTGEKYIGRTIVGVKARWSKHVHLSRYTDSQSPLSRAIRCYGRDGFTLSILETGSTEIQDPVEREKYFIATYSTNVVGYNATSGGLGRGKGPVTEVTRERMRKSHAGKTLTPEHCRNISEGQKGNRRGPATSQKLSDSLRGRKAPNKGVPHTEQTKQKMSESRREGILRNNPLLRKS